MVGRAADRAGRIGRGRDRAGGRHGRVGPVAGRCMPGVAARPVRDRRRSPVARGRRRVARSAAVEVPARVGARPRPVAEPDRGRPRRGPVGAVRGRAGATRSSDRLVASRRVAARTAAGRTGAVAGRIARSWSRARRRTVRRRPEARPPGRRGPPGPPAAARRGPPAGRSAGRPPRGAGRPADRRRGAVGQPRTDLRGPPPALAVAGVLDGDPARRQLVAQPVRGRPVPRRAGRRARRRAARCSVRVELVARRRAGSPSTRSRSRRQSSARAASAVDSDASLDPPVQLADEVEHRRQRGRDVQVVVERRAERLASRVERRRAASDRPARSSR